MIGKRKKEKETMAQARLWRDEKSAFTFVAQGLNVPVIVRKVESGMPPLFKVELQAVKDDRAVIWVNVDEAKLVFDFHCLRLFALDAGLPNGCTTITALVSIVWREGEWRAELLAQKALRGKETLFLVRPVLLGNVVGQLVIF